MENHVPITFAEATTFGTILAQTFVMFLTAELTIVFAYLAALYFFIHKTRMVMRVFAHVVVLIGIIYIWSAFLYNFGLGGGVREQVRVSIELGVIAASDSSFAHHTDDFGRFFFVILNLIQLILVIGLSYIAFFFDWSKPEGVK